MGRTLKCPHLPSEGRRGRGKQRGLEKREDDVVKQFRGKYLRYEGNVLT